MQADEIKELFEVSRRDGAKLHSVADALHKVASAVIALFALAGLVSSFVIMQDAGFLAGVLVLSAVGALCFLLYAFDIIATNTAKVLVHILFANLAKLNMNIVPSSVSVDVVTNSPKWQFGPEETKIKNDSIECLVRAGYIFSGEETAAQGIVWKFIGKSGGEFVFSGLDELKKFADVYKGN